MSSPGEKYESRRFQTLGFGCGLSGEPPALDSIPYMRGYRHGVRRRAELLRLAGGDEAVFARIVGIQLRRLTYRSAGDA